MPVWIVEINFDTGAYASLCGPVLERACCPLCRTILLPNLPTSVATATTPIIRRPARSAASVYVQSEFALDLTINVLAEKVGITPWEITLPQCAIERGARVLPNGQIATLLSHQRRALEVAEGVYEQNMDPCRNCLLR
ncbi:MAG: hypothetical protein ACLUD2_14720 [Clostridium sp.]